MILFIRSHQTNPHTGTPLGLVRVDGDRFQTEPGGPWHDGTGISYGDPACPVTVCAATSADYEREARRLIWNGLKTMLIRWWYFRRDILTIRRWEA